VSKNAGTFHSVSAPGTATSASATAASTARAPNRFVVLANGGEDTSGVLGMMIDSLEAQTLSDSPLVNPEDATSATYRSSLAWRAMASYSAP